jgi:hypothetical protein
VGLNNEGLASVQWQRQEFCVFDIETAPILDAADYIEVGDPPANYKKLDTIESWRKERFEKLLADAALDLDLLRIVAIGVKTERAENAAIIRDPEREAAALDWFWKVAENRTLIGFNISSFDLLALLRRSLYLGVTTPRLRTTRYTVGEAGEVVDLADILSFNRIEHKHSLPFYCKRFGIEHKDTVRGADIPMLVTMKQWEQVEAHVRSDVKVEHALAVRVGVLPSAPIFSSTVPEATGALTLEVLQQAVSTVTQAQGGF